MTPLYLEKSLCFPFGKTSLFVPLSLPHSESTHHLYRHYSTSTLVQFEEVFLIVIRQIVECCPQIRLTCLALHHSKTETQILKSSYHHKVHLQAN